MEDVIFLGNYSYVKKTSLLCRGVSHCDDFEAALSARENRYTINTEDPWNGDDFKRSCESSHYKSG